jgi:hypothetical protein
LHSPKDTGIEKISPEEVLNAVETMLEKTKYSLTTQ